MATIQVFDGQTANGNSTEVTVRAGSQGVIRMSADATSFDSGKLKLQFNEEASGGTWKDADGQLLGANGFVDVFVAGAKRLRANLASVASAANDLDCFLTIPDEMLAIKTTNN